ncbi:MAG: hypothetical protein RPT95_10460 [Candidatus Sedimenticola sp. (ex Thyasira tokunagai)]
MARDPIHLEAAGPRNNRQAMWEVIRKIGKEGKLVTVRDVRGELPGSTGLHKVRDYMTGLAKAGYLKMQPQKKVGELAQYELTRDTGIDAPRVRKDGTEVTQGKGREQLWRTMRILSSFDARELIHTASVKIQLSVAKEYVRYLHKAGYLVQTTKAKNGGGLARYRLLPSKYTGPKPPMIQRIKQVYDPNLGEVVWRPGGEA